MSNWLFQQTCPLHFIVLHSMVQNLDTSYRLIWHSDYGHVPDRQLVLLLDNFFRYSNGGLSPVRSSFYLITGSVIILHTTGHLNLRRSEYRTIQSFVFHNPPVSEARREVANLT